MRKVSIFAGETCDFRNNNDTNIVNLGLESAVKLLRATGFPRNIIDGIIVSSCSQEQYLSSIIAEILGIRPKISHKLENLCNSGSNAIISGYSYIASGLCDSILIVGVEKTNTTGKVLKSDLSRGQFNLPIYWGSIFKKLHMKRYGTTEEQICAVSVDNYAHAKNNENALNRNKQMTLEQILNSKMLIEPLKLLECCSICEGASSVLLVADEKIQQLRSSTAIAKKNNDFMPVSITGVGQQTNAASFSNAIEDIFVLGPAKLAAHQAYKMAGLRPSDISVAEIHDAFSILEIMAYEDLGFARKGNGGQFVSKKQIHVNPRGGLIGCGHPIGATGVAQTVEIYKQLSGQGGNRQINDALKFGLVHNLAAAGTSATVLILAN